MRVGHYGVVGAYSRLGHYDAFKFSAARYPSYSIGDGVSSITLHKSKPLFNFFSPNQPVEFQIFGEDCEMTLLDFYRLFFLLAYPRHRNQYFYI